MDVDSAWVRPMSSGSGMYLLHVSKSDHLGQQFLIGHPLPVPLPVVMPVSARDESWNLGESLQNDFPHVHKSDCWGLWSLIEHPSPVCLPVRMPVSSRDDSRNHCEFLLMPFLLSIATSEVFLGRFSFLRCSMSL